jgi:hypothetical protein
MININAFIGEPLNFKNKFWIYPPKVKEVITNTKFATYSKILTFSADDIQDELKGIGKEINNYPTPFEFLLANCYHSKDFRELTIEAFEYFCHIKIIFLFEEKKIAFSINKEVTQE